MRPTRATAVMTGLILLATAPTVAASAAAVPPPTFLKVQATAETPAVEEGNADDPAIWVNPQDPAKSLVIGALKNIGLGVYDLDGNLVQELDVATAPPGAEAPSRFNNVDLVHGFRLGGKRVDLAVVTDRGLDQIRTYRIDGGSPTPLVDVSAANLPLVFSATAEDVAEQATAYGIAAWTAPRTGKTLVYVTQRNSLPVAEFELIAVGGSVTYQERARLALPGTFTLPDGTSWTACQEPGELAQSEAMVVDARARLLYIAQEDVGIWRVPVPYGRGEPKLIQKNISFGVPGTYDEETEECLPGADPGFGGKHITADVEGLQVVPHQGRTLLFASSQGDSTFAVYDRSGTRYRGGFEVVGGPVTDGADECDGISITTADLGPRYPNGLAVIHDGVNTPGAESSNFKYVPLQKILGGLRP